MKEKTKMWFKVLLMCLGYLVQGVDGAQFIGGSMSFETKTDSQGKTEIQLYLLTGWVLGTGPCGKFCNSSMTGMDTRVTRNQFLSQDSLYFGNWSSEDDRTLIPNDISNEVKKTMQEKVKAVSEHNNWELDQASITVKMADHVKYTDLIYSGQSWVPLSIQYDEDLWHLQVKITAGLRSDTGKPNQSPVIQMKPMYRLGYNRKYRIAIPSTDRDGDSVQCRAAQFIELGSIKMRGKHNYWNITQDCYVDVHTSEFQINDTGVIAVSLSDYNMNNIEILGVKNAPFRQAFKRILSTIPIQFYITIAENVSEPEFVKPTPPINQRFEIYTGAMFHVDIYAKATAPNSVIERFYLTRQDDRPVTVSQMKDVGNQVKSVTVQWKPDISDIGSHILCARAEDSDGSDTFNLHCFIIQVKESNAIQGPVAKGKPYFVLFPKSGDIECNMKSVCSFPIYAATDNTGGIKSIDIETSPANATVTVSSLQQAPSTIGPSVSMVQLSFQDSVSGKKEICLKTSDANTLIVKCVTVIVLAKNPCGEQPCQNDGECIVLDDGSGFQCICVNNFVGLTCDKRPNPCDKQGICKHNETCTHYGGLNYYCNCNSSFTGRHCESELDYCRPDPCKHGICESIQHDYVCHCVDGYTGKDCNVPPTAPTTVPTCSSGSTIGCSGFCSSNPCLNNASCVEEKGLCVCSIGYSGTYCENSVGAVLGSTDPKFVYPTPPFGTQITCSTYQLGPKCHFPVYIDSNQKPKVSTELAPNILDVTFGNIRLANIPGTTNLYVCVVDMVFIDLTIAENKYVICLNVMNDAANANPTDKRCFSVQFEDLRLPDWKGDSFKPDCNFVFPTLPAESKLVCTTNALCHVLLYTLQDGGECKQVIIPDAPIAFSHPPTVDYGTRCLNDVAFDATKLPLVSSNRRLCIKSCESGESRCYNVDVVSSIKDSCESQPCLHGGTCISDSTTFKCICSRGFTGRTCQQGACLQNATLQCDNSGHCHTDGATESCYCRLGYADRNCKSEISKDITDPLHDGAKFNGGAIPKTIQCFLGEPCGIPIISVVPPNKRPNLRPGFLDPEIVINGISTQQDNTSSDSYHTTVNVVGHEEGSHKMCLQSYENDGISDEICYTVNIKKGNQTFISKKLPYFVQPTLPTETSMECQYQSTCHLSLWVKNRDGNNTCPSVLSSISAEDGIYVFQPKNQKPCSADVTIRTDTKKIVDACFTVTTPLRKLGGGQQIGGDGEERCYKIDITDKLTVKGPCGQLQCINGGFCDGHSTLARCICLSGFSGTTCNIGHGVSLTNSNHSAPGKVMFGDFAIPKTVQCVLGKDCHVPTIMSGDPNKRPLLVPGFTSGGLVWKSPSVIPNPLYPNGTYTSIYTFKGTGVGLHRTCLQTKSSIGTTDDEVCFDVQVNPPPGQNISNDKPHFTTPTMENNSTVTCVPGSYCHIIMHTSAGKFDGCPTIEQTQGPTKDRHIFQSNDDSDTKNCSVDVSLVPPSNKTGSDYMCFQTIFHIFKGEDRCFTVNYGQVGRGPCAGHTCQNGGKCVPNSNLPRCICTLSTSGANCEKDGSLIDHSHNPPEFSKFMKPETVVCVRNVECKVPFLINGGINSPPLVGIGHVDSGVSVKFPDINVPKSYPKGSYSVTVPFKGSENGTHSVCIQTKSQTGSSQISEHCFNVEVVDPVQNKTQDLTKPHFVTPSITNESTVTCKKNTECHLVFYQAPDTDGTCHQVPASIVPGGMYILTQDAPNAYGLCPTEVQYTSNTAGLHQTCLQAQNKSMNGEIRCFKINVTNNDPDPTPCEQKVCNNGGYCIGPPSGQVSDAECVCQSGYFGADCSNEGGKKLTNPMLTPINPVPGSTDPKFTDTAVPDTLSCIINEPCHLPLLITGDPNTKPLVSPDYLPDGVVFNSPKITKHIGSPDGTYKAELDMTANKLGNHSVCVKTQHDQSGEADVICYHINVQPKTSNSQGQPHGGSTLEKVFGECNIGNQSVLKCVINSACHLLIHTGQTPSGNCIPLQAANTDEMTVHAFSAQKDTDGKCVSDIVYQPKPGNDTKELCLTGNSAGGQNEAKRCYQIQTSSKIDACHDFVCLHDGQCVVKPNKNAQCVCGPGYLGKHCETEGSFRPIDTKGPSIKTGNVNHEVYFTDTAIPVKIPCILGQPCHIPFLVTGDPNQIPDIKPEISGNGIKANQPVIVKHSGSPNGTYKVDFNIQGNEVGSHDVCLNANNPQGQTSDQLCFKVDVKPNDGSHTTPSSNGATPNGRFENPSIPDKSALKCEVDSTCHVLFHTTAGPGNTCDSLSEANGLNDESVNIFPPKRDADGKCVVDLAYHPTSTMPFVHPLCLRVNRSGSTSPEKRCIMFGNIPDIKGCDVHTCFGDGKCTQHANDPPSCICKAGLTGDNCQKGSNNSVTEKLNPGGPTIVDTPLPKEIVCYRNQPCGFPIVLNGDPNTPNVTPVIVPGYHSNDITVRPNPTTLKPGSSSSYSTAVQIVSTTNGNKHVCIQTQGTQSTNNEACFKVTVKDPNGPAPNNPTFTANTLPSGSKVNCQPLTKCHFLYETTPDNSNNCPSLSKNGLGTNISDVFVFTTMKVGQICKTEVTIKPNESEIGNKRFCVQISGTNEDNCYDVNVSHEKGSTNQGLSHVSPEIIYPTFGSGTIIPCSASGCDVTIVTDPGTKHGHIGNFIISKHSSSQSGTRIIPGPTQLDGQWHFVNKVHLVPDPTGSKQQKICIQANAQTDSSEPFCVTVDTQSGITPPPPGSKIIGSALPDESVMTCYIGTTCSVGIITKGNETLQPTSQSEITPNIAKQNNPENSMHNITYSPGQKDIGHHRLCVETTSNGGVPEKRCFIVKVQPKELDFTNPTPSTNTSNHVTIKPVCIIGELCSFTMETPGDGSVGIYHCSNSSCNTGPSPMLDFLTNTNNNSNIFGAIIPAGFTNDLLPGDEKTVCFDIKTIKKATDGTGGTVVCQTIVMKGSQNCSKLWDVKSARKAVKYGRASCTCNINGTQVTIVHKRPRATTAQLLRAAGIGASSVTIAMIIASVIYVIVGKLTNQKPVNKTKRRKPISR